FSIDQRDTLRMRSGVSGNVGVFRLAREPLGGGGGGRPGLLTPFLGLCFLGLGRWPFRGSSLSFCRPRGPLTRCSFAARLRCHCCSCKISLMAQASSTRAMLVYCFLPVHRIVNFARLCFVDR